MKENLPTYPRYSATGVAWLGDLPSHWETRQLGFISNRVSVGLVINPSSYVSDEGVPFLLGGDIREFKIDAKNCNYCAKEVSDGILRNSRLSEGDLVVVRVGYPGVAAVVPPELEGANCASMMVVRRHERFCSQWLEVDPGPGTRDRRN
jgi:type I restriction enzyme S subunit